MIRLTIEIREKPNKDLWIEVEHKHFKPRRRELLTQKAIMTVLGDPLDHEMVNRKAIKYLPAHHYKAAWPFFDYLLLNTKQK